MLLAEIMNLLTRTTPQIFLRGKSDNLCTLFAIVSLLVMVRNSPFLGLTGRSELIQDAALMNWNRAGARIDKLVLVCGYFICYITGTAGKMLRALHLFA